MPGSTASGGVLSFKPTASSYFYENFPCEAATTAGYNSIQFSLNGPAGGSLTVELQTQSSCSATTYRSTYYTVSGLTGSTRIVTIPLSSFAGANLNAITSIVWESFAGAAATWQIGNVQFGCSATVSTVSSASSSSSSSSSKSSSSSSTALGTSTTSAGASETCTSPLLIDDFISQSRLTFLYYNAMLEPSSDDGTMTSIVVGSPSQNRVTLTPKAGSYFYSEFPCLNAKAAGYGGISMRIKAPAGTTFGLEFGTGCDANAPDARVDATSAQLGWTFDGTEKLYTIPFSKFGGLDTTKLFTLVFSGFNHPLSFGPMAFYCGNSGTEYIVPSTTVSYGPSATVAAPTGTAPTMVIDTFTNSQSNDLGFWHGYDDGMNVQFGTKKVTLSTNDADLAFYTTLGGGGCVDFSRFKTAYLHIMYTGSTSFTTSLQHHNSACNDSALPYPGGWDSLETSRYAANGNIYIPINHFNIDLTKALAFSFHGFYTTTPVTFSKIEIVDVVPPGFTIPSKLPSGDFLFQCTRPNSFAFGIDDGSPELAQQVIQTVKKYNISVTFFTLGMPLLDPTTNLSLVYREMKSLGHQIAYRKS